MVGCLLNQNARRCQLIPVPTLTNTRPAGLDLLNGGYRCGSMARACSKTSPSRSCRTAATQCANSRWTYIRNPSTCSTQFHVTMRMTGMNRFAKGVCADDQPQLSADLEEMLEHLKWNLWHGKVSRALEITDEL